MQLFALECLASILVSGFFFMLRGSEALMSSLLGGALFVLPQLYFGYKAFAAAGARQIEQILANFYRGESGKILLIGAGFAVVHKLQWAADLLAMYTSFIIVLMLNAFLPGMLMRRCRQAVPPSDHWRCVRRRCSRNRF
jgi:ATP synthase protein I